MADRYWVGGSGNWNDTAHWSATSGGTSGASVPTSADTVTIDASSGTGTLTTTIGATCSTLTINSSTLGFNLVADLTVIGTTTLTLGTITLDSYSLTTDRFNSSNTNSRTLAFGTGRVVITGNNATVWNTSNATSFETTGSKNVEFYYTGSTGTRTINQGSSTGDTETNAFNVIVTGNGTDTITLSTATSYLNVDFSGFRGTWTNTQHNIYGNLVLPSSTSGMIIGSGAGTVGFRSTSGIKTLTTNGNILDFPVDFNGIGGTWQLQDAMTVGSSRITTLTNGTLDLNDKVLSTGFFSSTNSNLRTIDFRNSSKIVVTNNSGTIGQRQWDCATATNLTISYINDPLVEFADLGSTQAYAGLAHGTIGGTEAKAISLSVLAGSIVFTTNTGAEHLRNVTFSDSYSGTVNRLGIIYGDTVLGANATYSLNTSITFNKTSGIQTITSKGKTISGSLGKSSTGTLQLLDDLTVVGTFTLSQGTLDLNNGILTTRLFSGSNSNIRSIAFGTGKIVVTGNNTDPLWDTRTATNFSYTGTGRVEFNYPGSVGTRVIRHGTTSGTEANGLNVFVTAGTDSFALGPSGTATSWGSVDFTGFSGILTGGPNNRMIYGNWKFSPEMTVSTTTPDTIIFASANPRTITSNGKTFLGSVIFNNATGYWQLQDAMNLGSSYTATLSNGTLDLNNYTLTTGAFNIQAGTKNITFNGGSLTLVGSGATVFNNSAPTGFTTTGTGQINMSGSTAKTFVGGGSTYTCAINQGGAGDLTISGTNTLGDITASYFPSSILLAANQTVSQITLQGSPTSKVTLKSSIDGTVQTITDTSGLNVVKNVILRDSTATGGAKFRAPVNLGNQSISNVTGWDFGGWDPAAFMQFMLNSFRS